MRILLFGKNGQLGRALERSLGSLGEVVALHSKSTEHCGDLKNTVGIAESVAAIRAEIVVNAAAWTDVDAAELEPEQARRVNTTAPAALAKAAAGLDAWFVHYSSDYVYDGRGNRSWTELDTPQPLNVYGQSKLDADELIAAVCPKHLILRTGWLYSPHGKNFPKSILEQAAKAPMLAVVADQEGSPTSADWVADMTAHALAQAPRDPRLSGLYHLAASGTTSWHAYACFLIDAASRSGWVLQASPPTIAAVSSAQYPTGAMRPKNCRLDTGKFRKAFQVTTPPWQEGVQQLLTELK